MGQCSGACCARFYLSYSKEILKRHAAEGIKHNGTLAETKMLADMVIPLDGGRCVGSRSTGQRAFAFTCRNFIDGKCSIYAKRPVVCRTHPAKGDKLGPNGGCSLDKSGACTLGQGTEEAEALAGFKEGRP